MSNILNYPAPESLMRHTATPSANEGSYFFGKEAYLNIEYSIELNEAGKAILSLIDDCDSSGELSPLEINIFLAYATGRVDSFEELSKKVYFSPEKTEKIYNKTLFKLRTFIIENPDYLKKFKGFIHC